MSEWEKASLECYSCGYVIHGEEPAIVTMCEVCESFPLDKDSPIEDKLHEIIEWLTIDYWDLLPATTQHNINTQLNLMGFTDEYFKKVREIKEE
jgi:hypothetical protein